MVLAGLAAVEACPPDLLVLGMLTDGTLTDKILHGALQSRPREQFPDTMVRSRCAGVAPNSAVMQRGDQLGLQRRTGSNPQTPALPDHAILKRAPLIIRGGDCQLGQEFL